MKCFDLFLLRGKNKTNKKQISQMTVCRDNGHEIYQKKTPNKQTKQRVIICICGTDFETHFIRVKKATVKGTKHVIYMRCPI